MGNLKEGESAASTLSPFKYGIFRKMWMANLASTFGSLIQLTGAGWLMTEISASRDMVALVQASTALPLVLFAVLAGAIADNFHRRKILFIANMIMALASLALMITTYYFKITPWGLLSFTFLIGCGAALNIPTWQATIGDIMPRHEIPSAVILNNLAFNTARSLAPALAGVIIALAGTIATFGINVLSYVPLFFVLAAWQSPSPPRTLPREKITTAIATGLRYVAMSPDIGKVILRTITFGFGSIAALALLPITAKELLEGGPRVYGLLLASFGGGGVLGAIGNSRLKRRFSLEALSRLSFICMALSLLVLGFSTSLWITCPVLLLAGACWVLSFSSFNGVVQLSSPRWVAGRALATYQMCSSVGIALGSFVWGKSADAIGISNTLWMAAFFLILGGALGLRFPLSTPTKLNLDLKGTWQEPPLPSYLTRSSGPIVIAVEYEIENANVRAFLAAVEQLRLIRLRNGAKRWSLNRDLHESRRWIMSYQFATWTEYVRHNLRTTHDDSDASAVLRELHAGAEPPKVSRLVERQSDWDPATPPAPTSYGVPS